MPKKESGPVYVIARYLRYFFLRFLRRIFFFFHFQRCRAWVFLKRLESFEVVAKCFTPCLTH